MFQEDPNAARTIFWRTPELVERVVDFLDVESALILAKTQKVALKAVQRPSVWNKLIRQSGLQSTVPEKSQENWGLFESHTNKLKTMKETLHSTLPTLGRLLAVSSLQMKHDLINVICEVFAFDVELVD